MKKKCNDCNDYDNGICDRYGLFTDPDDTCKIKKPGVHRFDLAAILIMFLMFGMMVFFYTEAIEPLPDRVELTSRTEKVVRTYYANPEIEGDTLVLQDAVLLSEVDVSRLVE